MNRDIAIVGMAVEAPDAPDLHGFWDVIRTGRSLTRAFPVSRRRNVEEFVKFIRLTTVYGETDDGPNVFHDGSFLDSVEMFDPAFFGMTPRQASVTDPHQRMMLRAMYLALEDAGCTGPRRDRQTGVFIGFAANPGQSYLDYFIRIDPSLGRVGLTGNLTTMLANRLSYLLDLHGPSFVVDSACSASLLAAHQACNALLLGDCETAVVAGARVVAGPVKHPSSTIGIESSDGYTRTLDDRADGTGFGEGCGAVVLKTLERAVADGDQIYAVIKGSATNHDGASEMMTAPDSAAQEDLLVRAWTRAGIDPRTLGYLELHGTATRVGDPIEAEGLRRAFSRYTDDKQFCAVGTVKANIGHLYEASGVMGLIKTALVLHHGRIPKLAMFEKPNRAIDFSTGPVFVPTETGPWPVESTPRRAGVSAFGLGGANCHLVLEEWADDRVRGTVAEGPSLFCLSARTETSLRRLVDRYVRYLGSDPAAGPALADLCYTTATSRAGHAVRLALVTAGVADLAARLGALASGDLAAAGELFSNVTAWAPDAGAPAAGAGGLAEAARGYVAGGDLDLAGLWPEPTPRIVGLPGYAFDESRCTIDFPEDWAVRFSGPLGVAGAPEEHPITHEVTFQAVDAAPACDAQVPVLALVDPATGAEDVLAAAGLADLRILRLVPPAAGEAGEVDGDDDGDGGADAGADLPEDGFRVDEAGMARVVDIVRAGSYQKIIFAPAFEPTGAQDVDELDRRLGKNLMGLLLLLKSLMRAGARGTVVVLTHAAVAVGRADDGVVAENAALIGLAKASNREYPGLTVKVVDVDGTVPAEALRNEIMCGGQGPHVLRGGQRFRERIAELTELPPATDGPYLRPGGTYLITGGTGGIGLATADLFSRQQPDITLVLLSRSGVPEEGRWDDVLAREPESRQAIVLRTLRQLRDRGTTIEVRRADAGDVEELTAALTGVQREHGRIDGIVHAAGVAGRHIIAHREPADVQAVIRPKILGAFVIDDLTRHDRPDFIVHNSSVAAAFPAGGQGDYAAANYYLDNLACANTDKACHVLAMDWVAWKEVGMAVDTGTNVDSTFKAITTDQGLAALDAALRSGASRVFAGEIHYGGDIVGVLATYDVALDADIVAKIDRAAEHREQRRGQQAERTKRMIRAIDVTPSGRPDGTYSALEVLLAQCWSHSFGYPTVDVTADFFDLGGDSIMALSLVGNVTECLEVELEASDLLMERTIEGLAQVLEMSYGVSADLATVDL